MDHTPAARPLVAIVGGGAAGIFTAWQINRLWPDRFELHLFERSAQPGGNAQSLQVEHDGRRYTLDAGAQFFDRGAQPLYTQALAQLGLGAGITSHATGITLWDSARHERLLWLPAQLDGFKRYTARDWQRLLKFAAFVVSAALLHAAPAPDWSLSVDDWFAGLPLPENFKRRTLKTFLYQFLSMPPAASGRASALYATDYFLRSIAGGSGADGSEGAPALFRVLQLQDGLAAALERALALSGATLHAAATVAAVSPAPGGVRLVAGGAAFNADLLVFACSPGDCAAMLAAGGQGDAELVPLLRALARDYLPLSIVLGQDTPGWMPADERYWEAVNTLAGTHDAAIAFSVWFGPLRPPGRSGRPVRLFKSWGSPSLSGAPAAGVFFEHQHQVLLPT
ncbi:MAG: NAD(P)-binding protein, partial [Rhodocyclaceae bacterium]|nr:NAD(P)-binding protein [Rhodocyclaceae bacterium]